MNKSLEEVKRILSDNPELSDVGQSQTEEAIALAEKALAVKFPASFREYLKTWGWLSFGPTEYMGLGTTIRSVVAVTERLRRDHSLPANFVVVSSHEGDEYVCLDTSMLKDGECPVVIWDSPTKSVSRPRAPTFGKFLESDLLDFVE
jgi:hypothetical protein